MTTRAPRRQTTLLIVFVVLVTVFVTTFRMGVVRGASMEPTYRDGQVVLVRRRGPFSGRLRRNDVVLLQKDRDVIIKRIYRLPGEEVDQAYPNVLTTFTASGRGDYYEQSTIQTPAGPVTHYYVPEGYVLVLGDNLRVSEDGRVFGPAPIRDVLGTVVAAPGPPYTASGPITQTR